MTRKLPNPPRHGVPPLFDCTPFRGPKLTEAGKPFEPKPAKPGAELAFKHNGREITGQVWADAPGASVWAVADSVAYRVSKSGAVLEVHNYRRADEAAA